VDLLLEQGAIVLAKTTMPELAFGTNGWSPINKMCRNPRHLDYSPGGSSSGTAAGIAAGFAPCGLGSDTAGSVRIPADCCGICGFRPSLGRYSCEGVVPLFLTRDTVGPIASSVSDLALLDAVLAGETGHAELEADNPAELLSGKKVGVPRTWIHSMAPDAANLEAVEMACAALKAAGATVVDVPGLGAVADLAGRILGPGGGVAECNAAHLDAYLKRRAPELSLSAQDLLAACGTSWIGTRPQYTSNPPSLSEDELAELMRNNQPKLIEIEKAYAQLFRDDALDAMLTPCLRMPPPSVVGPGAPEDDPGRAFRRVDQGLVAITHNFCSIPVPSVALPTAARHAPSGLPAGVLLWGAPREDRQVLSLAMGLELLFAEKKSNVPVTA